MRPVLRCALAGILAVTVHGIADAAVRAAPTRAKPAFPRVVREDFVKRLAAKAPPVVAIEPIGDYQPRCCFEPAPDSMCVANATDTCWIEAADGCGPERESTQQLPAYWPEGARRVAASGSRWGEVSREEQRRSIQEILRVLSERQPAKPVGLAAYAFGYIESGFNPTAIHPRTKACGLFQFLEGTWRDFAPEALADDPTACTNARANVGTAITFLSHLYDTYRSQIADQVMMWDTLSEWEQVSNIFLGLYVLHNYGQNYARWQDADNGARQIALAHINVLKDFYDGVQAEMVRAAVKPKVARAGVKQRRRR